MHTTLSTLKNVKACIPGYGRMISFFGTAANLKEQNVPLHAVALIGGASDAEWALNNGVILEKEQFKAFYRRHAVSVFKYLCASNLTSNTHLTNFKHPIIKQLVDRSMKVQTFEEFEQFMEDARGYNFDHRFFASVMNDAAWNNPFHFISQCFDMVHNTYEKSNKWAHTIDPNPVTGKKIHNGNLDDDEDGGRRNYNDDDEDEDEDDRPTSRRAPKKSDTEFYWIKSTRANHTKGQNYAFCLNESPYEFIGDLDFKKPKGLTIVKEGNAVVMKAEMHDTKNMFYLIRELNAKSVPGDQDESE